MLTIYSSDICIDCRNFKAMQRARGFEAEYVDITASTDNLKAFLKIRDTEPIFDAVRSRGGIGIPLFVLEDGRMSVNTDEALSWIGQPPVRDEEYPEHRVACASCG